MWQRFLFPQFVRHCSSSRNHITIKTLLKSEPINERFTVSGWVKGIRRQKELTFIDIDDGSHVKKLQVVIPTENLQSSIGYHTSVSVAGVVQQSAHKGQALELMADSLQLIGEQQKDEYPFKARKKHPPEYVRQYPHLRARTNAFSSMLRVRSQVKMAMHNYFNQEGFINIDTPILTSNDCEGGGEVFMVQPLQQSPNVLPKSQAIKYFGQPAYLTVSGQLHLEAMASGMSKVYNFNPAFRAENSQTKRHLAEFWMVEAEEAFLAGPQGLERLMGRIEGLLKASIQDTLKSHADDVFFHWKQNDGTEKLVEDAISLPFVCLPYSEAMTTLQHHQERFKTKPSSGSDLGTEHESFLTKHVGNRPVFVTEWPRKTKAFYMCTSKDDPEVVLGVDLLLPRVGEVAGGGLRESRVEVLEQRLEEFGLKDHLRWYLELRHMGGGAPSGGFGVGFERFLQFLLGISSIRDVMPFPRWARHCQF